MEMIEIQPFKKASGGCFLILINGLNGFTEASVEKSNTPNMLRCADFARTPKSSFLRLDNYQKSLFL
jgi:hypothetical protein